MCVLCLLHSVVLVDEEVRGQALESDCVLNLSLPFTISETLESDIFHSASISLL